LEKESEIAARLQWFEHDLEADERALRRNKYQERHDRRLVRNYHLSVLTTAVSSLPHLYGVQPKQARERAWTLGGLRSDISADCPRCTASSVSIMDLCGAHLLNPPG